MMLAGSTTGEMKGYVLRDALIGVVTLSSSLHTCNFPERKIITCTVSPAITDCRSRRQQAGGQ